MDLHVIGAGPAGCISAISAIKSRNADALISEQMQEDGRNKSCSGLFSLDGMDSLKGFVDYKKTKLNEIYGANIHLAGEKLCIKTRTPVAVVCDRKKFDEMLIENAEREGAKIRFGERIGDAFESTNIIGADGANSTIASHFGFPKIKRFVATLKTTIKYESAEPKLVDVFFSNSMFPGFFGWIIPHNEEECEVGCGVELPHNPKSALDALLKIKKINKTGKIMGAIIPISVRQKTAMRKDGRNILLVGDAAGQVKSTTGGGVIFGGNCAKIAGKYFDDPLKYELGWRKRFGLDLHAHWIAHEYLAKKNNGQLERLCTKLKSAGIEKYLSEHGHMDKPLRMINLKLANILFGLI
jgi:geranylgeranyl reductase family protein